MKITQEVLEELSVGLEGLMKKYKTNTNSGDKERFKATKEAHAALRKVILMMAISDDIKMISPIKNGKKHGWMVVDSNDNSKNY